MGLPDMTSILFVPLLHLNLQMREDLLGEFILQHF